MQSFGVAAYETNNRLLNRSIEGHLTLHLADDRRVRLSMDGDLAMRIMASGLARWDTDVDPAIDSAWWEWVSINRDVVVATTWEVDDDTSLAAVDRAAVGGDESGQRKRRRDVLDDHYYRLRQVLPMNVWLTQRDSPPISEVLDRLAVNPDADVLGWLRAAHYFGRNAQPDPEADASGPPVTVNDGSELDGHETNGGK